MIPNMKEILEKCRAAKVGKDLGIEFPSMFPAIDVPMQGICVEKEEFEEGKGYCQIALYWMGLHVSDVCVEVRGQQIVAEVL